MCLLLLLSSSLLLQSSSLALLLCAVVVVCSSGGDNWGLGLFLDDEEDVVELQLVLVASELFAACVIVNWERGVVVLKDPVDDIYLF